MDLKSSYLANKLLVRSDNKSFFRFYFLVSLFLDLESKQREERLVRLFLLLSKGLKYIGSKCCKVTALKSFRSRSTIFYC